MISHSKTSQFENVPACRGPAAPPPRRGFQVTIKVAPGFSKCQRLRYSSQISTLTKDQYLNLNETAAEKKSTGAAPLRWSGPAALKF